MTISSRNKVIKDIHTLREREHISRFIKTISNIVKTWSFERSSEVDNFKKFYYQSSITSYICKEANDFLESKPKIKLLRDYDLYLVSKKETDDESFKLYYEITTNVNFQNVNASGFTTISTNLFY